MYIFDEYFCFVFHNKKNKQKTKQKTTKKQLQADGPVH